MTASKEEKVNFVALPGIKESYQALLTNNPEIQEANRLFNEYKRHKPPKELPKKMKDHALSGQWAGYRECHLSGNILLIYTHEDDVITMVKIYSHADISGKRGKRNIKAVKKLI